MVATEILNDSLLDRRGLAAVVGMSPEAISTALCRGEFPLQPIRIGRRLRWRRSSVERWMDQAEAEAAGAGR